MTVTYNDWGFDFIGFRFEGNDGFSLIQGQNRFDFEDFREVKKFLGMYDMTLNCIVRSGALSANYGKLMKASRLSRDIGSNIILEYNGGLVYLKPTDIPKLHAVLTRIVKRWGKYVGEIRGGILEDGKQFSLTY